MQRHTVAQIVRVPAPQIQEQIVVVVMEIPRALFREQIEEQIVDFLVSPIVEKMLEMAQITSQERFTAEHCGSDCSRSCATACTCRQSYSACSSDRRRPRLLLPVQHQLQ